jgi:hypothetical protein
MRKMLSFFFFVSLYEMCSFSPLAAYVYFLLFITDFQQFESDVFSLWPYLGFFCLDSLSCLNLLFLAFIKFGYF